MTRQLNRRGVLVVRGVVPTDTAVRWRDDLMVRYGLLLRSGLGFVSEIDEDIDLCVPTHVSVHLHLEILYLGSDSFRGGT